MILPISIVITSIGENILEKNLHNLTRAKYKFNEIIVVIPSEYVENKSKYFEFEKLHKIKFFYTNFKGQVNQRIYGFKKSRSDFVLQLDCDCLIDPYDIYNLYIHLNKMPNKNSSIAPVFYNEKSKIPIHKLNNNFTHLVKNIITYLVCGSKFGIFKMGTISKIGNNYGIDPNYMFNEIYNVDWLPGGCILHYRINLYLDNYYPFDGKAYCEDLIHSFYLKKNNIQLFVLRDSSCYTELPNLPTSFKELNKYLKVQKYFSKLINKKIFLGFYLWMYLTYIRYFLLK